MSQLSFNGVDPEIFLLYSIVVLLILLFGIGGWAIEKTIEMEKRLNDSIEDNRLNKIIQEDPEE